MEYGGIRITESQLKKAVGASKVLQDIKKQGWRIADIYYRANGIININCRDGNDEAYNNFNVTLKLKGRRVYYDTTISPKEKTRFEKASYIGIYGKSSTKVNKVTYPKKFPLS